MNNLILIGMMGCGKSTVGRLAAEKLGLAFVDTDERIERASGRTIPEIFASEPPFFAFIGPSLHSRCVFGPRLSHLLRTGYNVIVCAAWR